MRRPARAFTLLELLLVVALIGLLASIASAGFAESIRAARTRSERQQILSDVRSQRAFARERLRPMIIDVNGSALRFREAVTTYTAGVLTSCSAAGSPTFSKSLPLAFVTAALEDSGGTSLSSICLNEDGRPADGLAATIELTGDFAGNKTNTSVDIDISIAGVIDADWINASREGAANAGGAVDCATVLGTAGFCTSNPTHACCEGSLSHVQ